MKALHLITATLVATLALSGYASTGGSGQVNHSSQAIKTLSEKSTSQEIAMALTGTWEGCMLDDNNSSYAIKMNYTPSKDSKILGNFYGTEYIYNNPNCQGEAEDRETVDIAILSIEHHKNPKYILGLTTIINDMLPHLKNTKWVPLTVHMVDNAENLLLISTDGQYLANDEFVIKKAK